MTNMIYYTAKKIGERTDYQSLSPKITLKKIFQTICMYCRYLVYSISSFGRYEAVPVSPE